MVAVVIMGLATGATMVLVFLLSLELRRREMETMAKLGGARARIRGLVAVEIVCVIGAGMLLAGVLAAITGWFATALTRMFVMLS
jgi:putative ABC transport system permease protein